MDPVPVSVRGVSRRFGRRTALEDVDVDVRPGEIVGLAGPNGSGKTTLLKILSGFVRPDRGEVRVLGHDPFRDAPAVMRGARFAFAPPALFDALTAREHLEHVTALGAAPAPDGELRRALRLVGLEDRAEDRVATFSFGMRQRLALAMALVPRPSLLVLDEPTDGLDPLAVLELRAILERLRSEEGVAVLLSSHLLPEVERLADRLLVLSEGRTLFWGRPEELVEGSGRLVLGTPEAGRAARALEERGIRVVEVDGEALSVGEGALDLETARRVLEGAGLRLESFHLRRPTLEQALFTRLARRDAPRSTSEATGTTPEEAGA